jgi:hypothetical protein
LLINMTTNSPASISTAVWTTRPAWNTRAAPWHKLASPDVTAASWSA